MTTDAKIAANRRNARHSTGPRTPKGKAVSRMNALRHGLLAQLRVLPGLEKQADWERHAERVFKALKPQGYLEEMLTWRIVLFSWRLLRAARYEREVSAISIEMAKEEAKPPAPKYTPGFTPFTVASLRENLSFIRDFPEMADDTIIDEDDAVALVGEAEQSMQACLDEDDKARVLNQERWTAAELRSVLLKIAVAAESSLDAVLEEVLGQVEGRLGKLRGERAEARVERSRTCRRSLLPPNEEIDKILRYEGDSERRLYKAMGELERLQAARGGTPAPRPAAL